jgi:hypothetical protein
MVTFLDKLKKFVNSTPLPSVIKFIYNPTAKDPFNTTLEELKATAPEPSQNWVRLGFDNLTSFGQPVWKLFLIAAAVLAVYFGANALKFTIDVISSFGVVILLGAVLYWIHYSFTKK